MKNVDEICAAGKRMGIIQAMEFGALLECKDDGTGRVAYQGEVYFATSKQVSDTTKLPQVKHMRQGIYLIPKKWRKPWGDSKYWVGSL